jgi:hypothetical protein
VLGLWLLPRGGTLADCAFSAAYIATNKQTNKMSTIIWLGLYIKIIIPNTFFPKIFQDISSEEFKWKKVIIAKFSSNDCMF